MNFVLNSSNALQGYYPLLLSGVGIIWGYAMLNGRVKDAEREIVRLKSDAAALSPVLIEIRTKLASIETTLEFLKKKE